MATAEGAEACRGATGRLTIHGDVIAVLCPDSLDLAGIHDLTELLSSRIPGVLVQETSGTPGAAARIRIRGAGSIMLDNEPLFVVDGVRVLSIPVRTTILGNQLPSRIDDFDVHDIAAIEVLHGPSTTAMYGVGATSGVIRIMTRRGSVGAPRWKAFAEAGPVLEVTDFPANYGQSGMITGTGSTTGYCTLDARARGVCSADATPVAAFNPLEQVSQFHNGIRQRYGAAIAGGSERLRYHAGIGHSSDGGVLEGNVVKRTNVRLNLDASPMDALGVALTSAYVAGDAGFPTGNNNARSVLSSGMLGNAVDDPVNRGYLRPLGELNFGEASQETNRLNAGLSLDWDPLSWLAIAAGLGFDRTDTDELERLQNLFPPPPETRTTGSMRVTQQTMGLSAVASLPLPAELRSVSRAGIDHNETEFEQRSRTVTGPVSSSMSRSFERITMGLYVEQQLSWRDRVSLLAAVRRDELRSARGSAPHPVSGSSSLTWVVLKEQAGRRRAIGGVRVHVGYGEVPGTPSPLSFPLVVAPLWEPVPELKTERTSEVEGGISSSLLWDRLVVSVTAYRKTTKNAYVLFYNPFAGDELLNGADVTNSGVEGMLRAELLDRRQARLSVGLGGWVNTNEATSVERGFHNASGGSWQRHAEGRPLGGYWQRRIHSFDDLNGDGTISRVNCPGQPQVADGPACEMEIGSEFEYLGSWTPRFELFVAPRLTLLDRIEISALLDYRGGHKQFNQTELSRCSFAICRAVIDPSAPLADQARAVAALSGPGGSGVVGDFVEDASFARLREVAVSMSVPRSWTSAIGGRPARFTLAGRNLATWTDYTGLDPETNASGPLAFGQADSFVQPPLRSFTARLSVGW